MAPAICGWPDGPTPCDEVDGDVTLRDELLARFFRYLAIESQSDGGSSQLPSSGGQARLASLLAEELRAMGMDEVRIDDAAIVTALRRGTIKEAPAIGFVAHLDTVDVGLSPQIHPQVQRYDGHDLCLNSGRDIWLRAAEHPELDRWIGHDLVLGDGTSVLGADNKAAIAIMMTMLSRLSPGDAHGDIRIAFVPDEETGLRGAKALDLARFPCDFAYTIDCCELGETVVENFNAARAEIVFDGVSAHPMSAKNVLVNPLLMAMDLIAMFDRAETPEATEGREGYFWFKDMASTESAARLTVMIRDFDAQSFANRKNRLRAGVEKIARRYPTGNIRCEIGDQYRNMQEQLARDPRPVERMQGAMQRLGIVEKPLPMRGGTDGAVLSARGIATPNYFTGALNFHSQFEVLPIPAFEASYQLTRALCLGTEDEAAPEVSDP